jgi:hypothetical protein
MQSWPGRVAWVLLALALVLIPLDGCKGGSPATTGLPQTNLSTQPLSTFIPPATAQPVITFIPPANTAITSSLSPLFTVAPPVAITTTIPVSTIPEPSTTTSTPPTSSQAPAPTTHKPPVVTLAPPENALIIEIDDPQGDFFDGRDQPIQAESYLDILRVEVYVAETSSFFRVKLGGVVPTVVDNPELALEWDFFIDADMNPTTGWAGNFIANDTGPDYFLRLIIQENWANAEIFDFKANKISTVHYQINGETIEFSFPSTVLTLERFNMVVATRKWLARSLAAVDKAPNRGYCNMPNGYVYIKPGLPELQFETLHAIVWYNEGNEERARWCSEAFEAAYFEIGRLWGIFPPRATLYVYAAQSDIVQGLQTFSKITPEEAAFYQFIGAPRPMNNVIHIPPGYDWRTIYHQWVLNAMDLFC